MASLSTILFFIWIAAMLVALWALRISQGFASRMPKIAARVLEDAYPQVAVIVPIKGHDADTPANLRAVLSQNYPPERWRLIFAVETADDPAVALIDQLVRESAPPSSAKQRRVRVAVAGLATTRGQKIQNQLAAVALTDETDDILVFMDADAHPAPNWIHALVIPLTYGPHIGATTGYRYYVPRITNGESPTYVAPGGSPGLEGSNTVNAIASVLNAGVAALFGPYRRTFAWGGSMALRRSDFFGYAIYQDWQNALSDDYVLAYGVKNGNVIHGPRPKIHFVPQCVVASDAQYTWPTFLEFAIRQYRITRICAPWVWLAAITGPILFLTGLLGPIIMAATILVRGIASPQPFLVAPASWMDLINPTPLSPALDLARLILMAASLYGMYLARGLILCRGMMRLLPEHAPAIAGTRFWFTLGYPIAQAVNLLALLGSSLGRRIVWRGVTYVMHSRTKTTVLRNTGIPDLPGTR
ncbi:MAG: glycosyltransferase family 2 protein [Phycisphaerae bacterium]